MGGGFLTPCNAVEVVVVVVTELRTPKDGGVLNALQVETTREDAINEETTVTRMMMMMMMLLIMLMLINGLTSHTVATLYSST